MEFTWKELFKKYYRCFIICSLTAEGLAIAVLTASLLVFGKWEAASKTATDAVVCNEEPRGIW